MRYRNGSLAFYPNENMSTKFAMLPKLSLYTAPLNRKMATNKARKRQAEMIFRALCLTPSEEVNHTDQVKRVAVIDACNILHTSAGMAFNCTSADSQNRKPNAMGLLLVTYELLAEDFEVRIVIPASYMNPDKVDNFFILEQVEQLRLLTIVPYWSHDDLRIIEMAATVGGFIVSNDKFYDHVISGQLNRDELSVIRSRTLAYKFERTDVAALSASQLQSPHSTGSSTICRSFTTYESYDFMSDRHNWALSTGISFQFVTRDDDMMYVSPGNPSYKAAAFERSLYTPERAEECFNCVRLLFEYIQQNFCIMFGVRPPKLPFFHPKFDKLPPRFVDFKKLYLSHMASEAAWQQIHNIKNK